jgi:hypothetical protein
MTTSDEDERARLRFKMRVTVAVTFAVGLAAVLLAGSCPIPWLQEALKEVGVAFMIAATLAATVDVALKNELIRDVFFLPLFDTPFLRNCRLKFCESPLIA